MPNLKDVTEAALDCQAAAKVAKTKGSTVKTNHN
jgi:hypothetical protein